MGSTTGSIIITVKGKEVYVGTTPPSSPVDNELWLDISENNVLKYYKASTKTWCVVNDVSEKFGDVYKYLQTNYYTKTETNSAVKEEIGKTTIIKKDGTVVNMKDAINSVIDTATEHTQKIEDINSKYNSVTGEITEIKTIATQTANKFNWLVKSGTSATDFTLTDRTATLVSDYINLKGLVTFSGLSSDTQIKINTAENIANSANTKAQGIIDNIYTKNTTTIDGGKIATGSIKASSIDVNNLFAQDITATGSITSPLLQSDDYIYTGATIEGEEYSDSGMIVDLRNKIIRTPKFCLRKDGTMFASEIHGGRYYGSTSTETAFIFHGFTGGNKDEADLLKVSGNSADGTSYTTYIDTDNDTFDFMKPCHFSYGMSSNGITSIGDVIAGVGTSNQVSLQGLKDNLMGSGDAYANGWEAGSYTLKAGKNTMIYAENILKTGVYLFVPSFRTTLPSGHIFSVGIFDNKTPQYPVTQYMDVCTMTGTGRNHCMNGIQIFNAIAGKRYYVMGYSTADIRLDEVNWFHIFCLKTT